MIELKQLNSIKNVPTLPSVATKILDLIFDEKATVNDVVPLVEADQSLTTKVLKIVNSASYGLARNVASMKHAINLIGFDSLRHLVLSISIFDEFFKDGSQKTSMNKANFWLHCISVALISKEIAKQTNYANPETAHIVGLLHDIGKVVIDALEPNVYHQIHEIAKTSQNESLLALETKLAGASHDQIGGYLASLWKLPTPIIDVISLHHFSSMDVFQDSKIDRHLVEIISAANFLCWAEGNGSINVNYVPAIAKDNFKYVRIDQLKTSEIYKTVDKELVNFADIFKFPIPEAYRFREALLRANMELGRLNTLYIIAQKKLEKRILELSTLNKAIRTARMSFKIDEIIQTLLKTIIEGLNFDRAFFYLIDEENHEARGHSFVGQSSHDFNFSLFVIPLVKENMNFYQCTTENIHPFIIDIEKANEFEKEILSVFKTTEMGFIPIISQKKVIALFAFDNPNSQIPLNIVNHETLSIIGNEAGMAIENIKLFEELRKIAITDELTQIFNRRQILIMLKHEFNRFKRYDNALSVIMADIDFFKKFNDLYGHDVGDKILVLTTNVIKHNIRQSDIFGRFGGEEFLIILPETNLNGAAICAEKLRKAVEDFGQTKVNELYPPTKLAISMGIAEFKKNHLTPDEVVKEADIALYEAKKNGRNRFEIFKKP